LEKFPNIKFVFAEYGFGTMVPFLWRFDKDWRGCRIETPWVKMPPSEYVKRNIRFTTQPLPEPKNIKLLAELMMEIEDSLLFSSDYPHWDNDMPDMSLQFLPEKSRIKIFYENAKSTFRL
jgi:Predicted metal-dependent hydrolase of the TIM-barrel fold